MWGPGSDVTSFGLYSIIWAKTVGLLPDQSVYHSFSYGMKLRLQSYLITLSFVVLLATIFMNFHRCSKTLFNYSNIARISIKSSTRARAMHIQSIPMWEGTGNNYAYLVTDQKSKDAVIIDPANPPEVLPVLKEKIASGSINLKSIINTHHHHDHAGGNVELLKHHSVPIIGGKDCDKVSRTPEHNSTFTIGESIKVRALHTPCHTQDSICYFFEDGSDKAVFTGDTLFIGGCGRFFEGTAEEMNKALNETLAALPDDTKVFPGHEYTKGNVKFGATVLQNEAMTKLKQYTEQHKQTQGKFTIGDEKQYNVFMKLDDPQVQKATGKTDPIEVMAKLREMKNSM